MTLPETSLAASLPLAARVGGVAGWIGREASFLLRRNIVQSRKHERATYLTTVADLGIKLRSAGMTVEDVEKIEALLKSQGQTLGKFAELVAGGPALVQDAPSPFNSTYGMQARAGAEYGVAQAKLEQALMDLRILTDEDSWELVEAAQQHWRTYRNALEDIAAKEWAGGTG